LRIIENQFEIDENPPDIRIYHNQKKFVSNRTSDFIDYHLDITPGIEQILEFDLYNFDGNLKVFSGAIERIPLKIKIESKKISLSIILNDILLHSIQFLLKIE